MGDTKGPVLLVCDSDADIQFVKESLGNSFNVVVADSEATVRQQLEQKPPATLIHADLNSDDGYAICRCIGDELESCSILFFGGGKALDQKLQAYGAGAIDFIEMPLDPREFLQKISTATAISRKLENANSEKQMAMETAMTSIMDAGEQATVIGFLRDIFTQGSTQDIAKMIVEATNQYGLSSTVQIRTPWAVDNASTLDPVPSLEIELIQRLKDSSRIHQANRRLILNFDCVSQLVKNMPEEDESKCGRFRDHLALILEAASWRCQSLVMDWDLYNLLLESNQSLLKIQNIQEEQKRRNVEIMDQMVEDVQRSFMAYGLTEEQEELLLNVVKNATEKSLVNFEEGLKADETMRQIVKSLNDLISSHVGRKSTTNSSAPISELNP